MNTDVEEVVILIMINEVMTYKKFGYYSYNLKPQTHKKIIAICDCCNKIREIEFKQYRKLCKSCANIGKNNPNYKNGKPKCIDCNKEINYYRKRCKSCAQKGQLNNMFGEKLLSNLGVINKMSRQM